MKILVVSVNWLGDCVMTLPVYKALKQYYPQAKVSVMVVGRLRQLFEGSPFIDEVIEFDERRSHRGVIAKIRFIFLLKRAGFNKVFFIHRSFTRMLICTLAGIPERIGFQRPKTNMLLTHKVNANPRNMHRGDYYLSLFESYGIIVKERVPSYILSKELDCRLRDAVSQYRSRYRNLIAINPSANWDLKRWPQAHFITLVRTLFLQQWGVLFIGDGHETAIVEGIKDAVPFECLDLCGKTGLRDLASVLTSVDIVLSNDSGPAHLAAAVGARVLVLFGPTSPEHTKPRGKNVWIISGNVSCEIPCYTLDCQENQCMASIMPECVMNKIRAIVS